MYTLQGHYLPEWEAEPPREWLERLRAANPVTERVSYLAFRYFAPFPSWNWPDRGQWALYAWTPRALVDKARARAFETHWSEMPTEGEQVARRSSISSYQHFMWHTRGVAVWPVWILQGLQGGTAAKYTPFERAILRAHDAVTEELPLGFLPPCEFDQRALEAVMRRDRLRQAGDALETLRRCSTAAAQDAEFQAAEKEFRRMFYDNWRETMAPQADFMRHWLSRSENRETLPPAPDGLASTLAQHKDHWVEHGHVIGARVANSRKVQLPVG